MTTYPGTGLSAEGLRMTAFYIVVCMTKRVHDYGSTALLEEAAVARCSTVRRELFSDTDTEGWWAD